MDILGEKLGPLIFQFPFFSRNMFPDRHTFTDRLVPFLKKLPSNHKFGIEIRNRDWLNAEFADLLRDHQIALVLQDRSWMPNPLELQFDPITAGLDIHPLGSFLSTGATIKWSAKEEGFEFQSEVPDPSRNLVSVGQEKNGVFFTYGRSSRSRYPFRR
jgi:hypothetical protein